MSNLVIQSSGEYEIEFRAAGYTDASKVGDDDDKGNEWDAIYHHYGSKKTIRINLNAGDILSFNMAEGEDSPGRTADPPLSSYVQVNSQYLISVYYNNGIIVGIHMPATIISEEEGGMGWLSNAHAKITQLNSPPTQPTITAPVANLKTKDNTQLVSWNFNDPDSGDTQSKYQVIGSTNNFTTTHYNSGIVTSTSNSMTTSAIGDGTWKFRVKVWDSKGAESPWAEVTGILVDTKAPANPSISGTFTNITDTSLTLNWGAFSDPAPSSGYNRTYIYAERWNGSSWVRDVDIDNSGSAEYNIYISDVNRRSYNVTGLTPGTRYRFIAARYYDNAANWGAYNFKEVWTKPVVPATPTGTATGLAWHKTEGRGKVILNWNKVTGATGYKVHVFDGRSYRAFDVGNVSTWDSSIWKIYPTEARINQDADNSRSVDIFNHSKTGLDLRDRPTSLYLKSDNTNYNTRSNYWFRISAYNSSGDTSSSGAYMPTLPLRTEAVIPNFISATPTTYTYKKGNDYWIKPNDLFKIKIRGNDDQSTIKYANLRLAYPDENRATYNFYTSAYSEFNTSINTDIVLPVITYNANGEKELEWIVKGLTDVVPGAVQYYFKDYAENQTPSYTNTGYRLGVDGTAPNFVSVTPTVYTYKSGNDYWIKPNDLFKIKIRANDDGAGIWTSNIRLNYTDANRGWYSYRTTDSAENDTSIYTDITGIRSTYNANGEGEVEWTVKGLSDVSLGNIQYYFKDSVENDTNGYQNTAYRLGVDGKAPNLVSVTPTVYTYKSGNDYWIKPNDLFKIKIRANDDGSAIWTSGIRFNYTDANRGWYSYRTTDNAENDTSIYTDITGIRSTYNANGEGEVEWTVKGLSDVPLGNIQYYFKDCVENDTNGYQNTLYRLGVDGSEPTTTKVEVVNVDMNGYDIEVTGAADGLSGINRVQFPTWSVAGGQDDLVTGWETNAAIRGSSMGSGTYRFRVDISDHGNVRGAYQTDVYVYDNAGNRHFAGGLTPYVNTAPVVTLSSDKAEYLKGEVGKLNINISDVDSLDTINYNVSAGVYAVMLSSTSGTGVGAKEITIDTSKFDINQFVWNGTRYEKDIQIDLSVTDNKGGVVNKAVTIKVYNNKPVVTQTTPNLSKLKPFGYMDISGTVVDDKDETLIGKYYFYSPLDNSKKTADRFIKGFVSTGEEGYFDSRIDYDKAYLDTIKDYLGGRDSEELTDVNLRLVVSDSNGGVGYADKVVKVKYNIVPDITVNNALVYRKEGESFSVTGNIIDSDMDNMIIKAAIGGVEKITTRVGAGAYTLTWNTSELLEGTYTGFTISVDDQMGGTGSVTYTNNIVVDKNKPVGTFTPNSRDTWDKTDVSVTIDTNDLGPAGLDSSRCQIRHSLNEGSTWTSWSALTVPRYISLLSPSDGKRMIEIKITDKAGNENVLRSGVYLIDKTNPVLTINNLEQGYDYIRADISATDTLSGVKDYRVDLGSDIGHYGNDTSKNYTGLKSNKRYTLKAYVRDNVYQVDSITRNIVTYAVMPQIDVIDTENNKVAVRVLSDSRNDTRPEIKIICINTKNNADFVEGTFTTNEVITVEGLTSGVNYKVDAVVRNIDGHEERKQILDNIMFVSNDQDPVIHDFIINYGDLVTTQDEIDMKLVASDDKTFEKDLKVQFDINGRKYGYDEVAGAWKENYFGDYTTYYSGFNLDIVGENIISVTVVDEGGNRAKLAKSVTKQTNTSVPVIEDKKDLEEEVKTGEIIYDEEGRILTKDRLVKVEYSSDGYEFTVSKDSVMWSPWEKVKNGEILKYVELDENMGTVKTIYVRVRDEVETEADAKVLYYLLDREGPEVNITTSNNIRIAKGGSVILKLEAKDSVSKDLSYKITIKSESETKTITGTTGGSTSVLETLSGLAPGSYSVEAVVKDQLGNEGKASMNLWSK
jgi:hypothetical protein